MIFFSNLLFSNSYVRNIIHTILRIKVVNICLQVSVQKIMDHP